MKFIINKYFLIFISLIILLIFTTGKMNFWFDNIDHNKQINENFKNTCKENIEIINDESYTNACLEMWNNPSSYDPSNFYTLFHTTFVYEFHNMNIYIFFFLIIPIAFFVCNKIKYSTKNELSRINYKKFKKSLFKGAYLSLIIVVIIVMYALFSCGLHATSFFGGQTSWLESTTSNVIFFSIMYLLNVLFYMGTYINIFLISARKNHNPIIAVIIAFLSVILIELFLEIVVNNFLFINIFNSGLGLLFNIINAFTFNEQFGVWLTVSIALIWFLLSLYFVHLSYKNKEKFIIDCEKDK